MSKRIEQADGKWKRKRGYHTLLKNHKKRAERRSAKANPECQPTYGKYRGYET